MEVPRRLVCNGAGHWCGCGVFFASAVDSKFAIQHHSELWKGIPTGEGHHVKKCRKALKATTTSHWSSGERGKSHGLEISLHIQLNSVHRLQLEQEEEIRMTQDRSKEFSVALGLLWKPPGTIFEAQT